MPNAPRFSICIPNYNNGKYLRATLESAFAQSYRDFEIVVSDNASTDDSVAITESFASDRIRLVRNPQNLGLSANFDKVVESSTGRHLLLLSADDLMHPTALARYTDVLDGLGPAVTNTVLIAAYDVIDSAGQPLYAMHRPVNELFYEVLDLDAAATADRGSPVEQASGHAVLAGALRRRLAPAPFVATCYPRELYDRVGGYRSGFRAWPDTHFALKLLSEDPALIYVPERLFSYRVHDNNQFAIFDRMGNLCYQIDSYLHTIEFPDSVLESVDVDRSELVSAYLTRAICGRAQRALANGRPSLAARYLLFGVATYPGQLLRRPHAYRLAAMAALGPIGRKLAARLPHS